MDPGGAQGDAAVTSECHVTSASGATPEHAASTNGTPGNDSVTPSADGAATSGARSLFLNRTSNEALRDGWADVARYSMGTPYGGDPSGRTLASSAAVEMALDNCRLLVAIVHRSLDEVERYWHQCLRHTLSRQQVLAFVMAKHPRLGRDSAARRLPKSLMRYVVGFLIGNDLLNERFRRYKSGGGWKIEFGNDGCVWQDHRPMFRRGLPLWMPAKLLRACGVPSDQLWEDCYAEDDGDARDGVGEVSAAFGIRRHLWAVVEPGDTLLHLASRLGRADVCEFILSKAPVELANDAREVPAIVWNAQPPWPVATRYYSSMLPAAIVAKDYDHVRERCRVLWPSALGREPGPGSLTTFSPFGYREVRIGPKLTTESSFSLEMGIYVMPYPVEHTGTIKRVVLRLAKLPPSPVPPPADPHSGQPRSTAVPSFDAGTFQVLALELMKESEGADAKEGTEYVPDAYQKHVRAILDGTYWRGVRRRWNIESGSEESQQRRFRVVAKSKLRVKPVLMEEQVITLKPPLPVEPSHFVCLASREGPLRLSVGVGTEGRFVAPPRGAGASPLNAGTVLTCTEAMGHVAFAAVLCEKLPVRPGGESSEHAAGGAGGPATVKHDNS